MESRPGHTELPADSNQLKDIPERTIYSESPVESTDSSF